MTRQDFYILISVRKAVSFEYRGKKYNLMCYKETDGKEIVKFGELYSEKKYDSIDDFYARAEIGNSYFREVLEDLELN